MVVDLALVFIYVLSILVTLTSETVVFFLSVCSDPTSVVHWAEKMLFQLQEREGWVPGNVVVYREFSKLLGASRVSPVHGISVS